MGTQLMPNGTVSAKQTLAADLETFASTCRHACIATPATCQAWHPSQPWHIQGQHGCTSSYTCRSSPYTAYTPYTAKSPIYPHIHVGACTFRLYMGTLMASNRSQEAVDLFVSGVPSLEGLPPVVRFGSPEVRKSEVDPFARLCLFEYWRDVWLSCCQTSQT